jgi:phage terminase large subunit
MAYKKHVLKLKGKANPKQQMLFDSRTKYTAYGGARGGGKSWALRRKIVSMCVHYSGIRCLIIRRSYAELRENHILPLQSELHEYAVYTDSRKCFLFPNGSRIILGYCANEADVLQYQGQEYDVIAIDEATQLTEYQFNTLKACLRGVNVFTKRMYLTCNPGGVGHMWVKRLFIDKLYTASENSADYSFIQAFVSDNTALLETNADYIKQLETLPEKLKQAWLYGRWDIFEGQYFNEFDYERHVCSPYTVDKGWRRFGAFDYGFDMLALLLVAVDYEGNCVVYGEYGESNLTLSEAAEKIVKICGGNAIEYLAASPDLWNRRQDSGYSGFEIMSGVKNLPPLIKADDRRVIGWRTVREYLDGKLTIFDTAGELIRCLTSLTYDKRNTEDVSGEPHDITHFPEALRYALMSRAEPARDNGYGTPIRMTRSNKGVNIADY